MVTGVTSSGFEALWSLGLRWFKAFQLRIQGLKFRAIWKEGFGFKT